MLKIVIPQVEIYDAKHDLFINIKEQHLSLEHSLVSISKWESIYERPFISDKNKTSEEIIEYIKCMTLTQNVDERSYDYIPMDVIKKINNYIASPMSATTFHENTKGRRNSEMITSELIYYWMVAYQIPFECQKWHLNRLLNLIRICNIKNSPDKKMSKHAIMQQNSELNKARRAALNTKG